MFDEESELRDAPISYYPLYALLLASAIAAMPAQALTLKKGQIIGGDGNVHDGASPEMQSQLIKNAQKTDFFGNKKANRRCWR